MGGGARPPPIHAPHQRPAVGHGIDKGRAGRPAEPVTDGSPTAAKAKKGLHKIKGPPPRKRAVWGGDGGLGGRGREGRDVRSKGAPHRWAHLRGRGARCSVCCLGRRPRGQGEGGRTGGGAWGEGPGGGGFELMGWGVAAGVGDGKTSAVQAARTNAAASPPNARPGPLGGRSGADDARVSYASATAGLGARPQPCLLQLLLQPPRHRVMRGEARGVDVCGRRDRPHPAPVSVPPGQPVNSWTPTRGWRTGGCGGGGGSRRQVPPATELYVPPPPPGGVARRADDPLAATQPRGG